MHVDGEQWCIDFFSGGIWKQTSYNHNFRKMYAGKGYVYDPVKDKFLAPQPFASWSFDANDDWQSPITYPSIINDGQETPEWRYLISWNETKYNADNTKVGKLLNQTIHRKHLPYTIGMAQLGCPNRRTFKCQEINLVQQMVVY